MLSPQASTQEANFKIVWKDGAKWKFEITEPVNQNSILQGVYKFVVFHSLYSFWKR